MAIAGLLPGCCRWRCCCPVTRPRAPLLVSLAHVLQELCSADGLGCCRPLFSPSRLFPHVFHAVLQPLTGQRQALLLAVLPAPAHVLPPLIAAAGPAAGAGHPPAVPPA